MSCNEKFRKASSKLQEVAAILAEQGMNSFNEKMAFIDELIPTGSSNKTCTLVETLTLENDISHNDRAEIFATGDNEGVVDADVVAASEIGTVEVATSIPLMKDGHMGEATPVMEDGLVEELEVTTPEENATHADEVPVEHSAPCPVPDAPHKMKMMILI